MGIRFRCHHCEHELNLKNFQAGRRARCPVCSGRFRVPTTSCDFSTPLEDDEQELASSALQVDQPGAGRSAASPIFELKQPTADLERFKRPAPETQRAEPVEPVKPAEPVKSAEPLPLASQKRTTKKGAKKHAPTAPGATSDAVADPNAGLPFPSQAAAAARSELTVESPSAAVTSGDLADAPQTGFVARSPGVPRAIAEAPQAVWYVRPPSGGQFGPADSATFYQWMQENRVAREALVWRDGWPQWMTAAEAFEEYFGPKWLVPEAAVAPAGAEEPLASLSGSAGVEFARPASGGEPSGDAAIALGALQGASVQVGSPAEVQAPAGAEIASPVRPLARRKRRRTNYALWISVLAIVAIALVAVLVTVLMSQ